MHEKSGVSPRLKAAGALVLIMLFLAGLTACGPTSQTTKSDDSDEGYRSYGGYGY